MAVDKISVPVSNSDSVALAQGALVRISASNAARRAQADSAENVAGLIGAAQTGANVGSPFNAIVGGQTLVLMEPSLTMLPGQTIYVSATVAGRGTNVAPDENAVPVGIIQNTLAYASAQLVTAVIQVGRPTATAEAPSMLLLTVTNGEEGAIAGGTVVWLDTETLTVKRARSLDPAVFRGTVGVMFGDEPGFPLVEPGEQGQVCIAGGPVFVQLEENPSAPVGDPIFVSNETAGYGLSYTDANLGDANFIPFAVASGAVTSNEKVPCIVTGIAQQGMPNSINGYALRNGAVVLLGGTGTDASGGPVPAACPGAVVGQRVQAVLSVPGTAVLVVTPGFESTITVADEIQQLSEDLTDAPLLVQLLPPLIVGSP